MEGVDIGKSNLQNYLAVVNKIEYDLCIPYVIQFFSLVYTQSNQQHAFWGIYTRIAGAYLFCS